MGPVVTEVPFPTGPQLNINRAVVKGCVYAWSSLRLISHICFRFCTSGEHRLAFVWRDWGVFTIICMFVGLLSVVDFLVMFFHQRMTCQWTCQWTRRLHDGLFHKFIYWLNRYVPWAHLLDGQFRRRQYGYPTPCQDLVQGE